MMMTGATSQKVTAHQLKRLAYLSVRQSTVRQVFENTESTARQYALCDRAVALGWPRERVITIDGDQGQSGASATDRAGFQTLVAEVGLGHVGIVLGLEVSRLARNNSDWHRLLEICALSGTLILDEDGVYDPASFNDRLLLGLKGAMSEAELHVLHARLRGGILNKARRAALKVPLPIGLAYAEDERVVLEPDQQVRQAVRLLFQTFERTGSARATVRAFREQGLSFPRRTRTGPHRGEVAWGPLLHTQVLHLLHNPRYAGAFVFGRHRTYKTADGHTHTRELPREEWHALFPATHEGDITWKEYENNLRHLRENAQARGEDRGKSPPREGAALLQGLVVCGRCGERMTVRYHSRATRVVPEYVCQREGIARGHAICQSVPGAALDDAIGRLLRDAMTPVALDLALTVQDELVAQVDAADRLRGQQVERARYEADLAQRRYLRVDPDNRLVADALEADWNAKLRAVAAAQEEVERHHQADRRVLDARERADILAVATDFPRLWQDPRTLQRDRKRMVRLLVEDVTLRKGDAIVAQIRFTGGATQTLSVPLPPPIGFRRRTDADVVREIDRLLDDHTCDEIAAQLNARGWRSFEGKVFHAQRIVRLRRDYGLRDRYSRLRAAGLLTLEEVAATMGVSPATIKLWRGRGLLRASRYNEKGECLYPPPDSTVPAKWQRKVPTRSIPHASSGKGAV